MKLFGRHSKGRDRRLKTGRRFDPLLYLVLVGIQLFGGSFKLLGADQAASLFSGLSNPFAGLAVGVLATVLVQSSSVTTATIVGLVGSGQLPISYAVPMIMGANIGTSITNTLVSLGYVTRNTEFKRAFAGATVHDFFNLLTVIFMLPIELATGILEKGATRLAAVIPQGDGEAGFKSPVKTAVKWLAKKIQTFFSDVVGLEGNWLAGVLGALAFVLIVVTLVFITRLKIS